MALNLTFLLFGMLMAAIDLVMNSGLYRNKFKQISLSTHVVYLILLRFLFTTALIYLSSHWLYTIFSPRLVLFTPKSLDLLFYVVQVLLYVLAVTFAPLLISTQEVAQIANIFFVNKPRSRAAKSLHHSLQSLLILPMVSGILYILFILLLSSLAIIL